MPVSFLTLKNKPVSGLETTNCLDEIIGHTSEVNTFSPPQTQLCRLAAELCTFQ